MNLSRYAIGLFTVLSVSSAAVAAINAQQQAVLEHYKAAAMSEDSSFSGFSAARGKTFFLENRTGGSPDTPSCTTCHTPDPTQQGQSRAGKIIDPMAVSKTPNRFSDLDKVEKWFTRNCQSVLGRDCTAQEKGDYITFLSSI
jgi:cytochrome c peroxidase